MKNKPNKDNFYDLTADQARQLERDYSYHAPNTSQQIRYLEIRACAKVFARSLIIRCPESKELSEALAALDTVVMKANAAIARNEKEVKQHDKQRKNNN